MATVAPSSLPPGPSLRPALQLLRFLRDPTEFLDDCSRRFGDVFTLRFPALPGAAHRHPPIVVVSDPDSVRTVFMGDENVLHGGKANADLRPLIGRGALLLLDGERHEQERRLMQPPFHGERVTAYGRAMQAIADAEIDGWPLGTPFSLHRAMQRITLEVIMRTVFGVTDPARTERMRTVVMRFLDLGSSRLTPVFRRELGGLTPWGRFRRAARELDGLLRDEIVERQRDPEARGDVLGVLLGARDADGNALTETELHDELMTLLVAGHETTASTLAWAVYQLLRHPEVAERVRAEVGNERVDLDTLPRLVFLDAVIKETLRLDPIVPFIGRVLRAPFRVAGWDLPTGVVVAPCIYLAHRRAASWPDPERFAPERFLGRAASASPNAFFPFGGGGRRCIGMPFALYEMKVVLATLLSRTRLALAPGRPPKPIGKSVTLVPSGGMPMVVLDRVSPPEAVQGAPASR
jgi:cytochrome P450